MKFEGNKPEPKYIVSATTIRLAFANEAENMKDHEIEGIYESLEEAQKAYKELFVRELKHLDSITVEEFDDDHAILVNVERTFFEFVDINVYQPEEIS